MEKHENLPDHLRPSDEIGIEIKDHPASHPFPRRDPQPDQRKIAEAAWQAVCNGGKFHNALDTAPIRIADERLATKLLGSWLTGEPLGTAGVFRASWAVTDQVSSAVRKEQHVYVEYEGQMTAVTLEEAYTHHLRERYFRHFEVLGRAFVAVRGTTFVQGADGAWGFDPEAARFHDEGFARSCAGASSPEEAAIALGRHIVCLRQETSTHATQSASVVAWVEAHWDELFGAVKAELKDHKWSIMRSALMTHEARRSLSPIKEKDMVPQTPTQVTPNAPEKGVVRALADIWHREGPLTAADLRSLTRISQAVSDVYEALDSLAVMCTSEVEDLENSGAQDPAKATRVVLARQALGRFDDLTLERLDTASVDVERLDDFELSPDGTQSPMRRP